MEVRPRAVTALGLGLVVAVAAACGGGGAERPGGTPAPPAATSSPPPATAPSPTETAPPGTYIVKEGDTLSEIAERFGTTVKKLARANKIKDPDLIRPGQELVIPEE